MNGMKRLAAVTESHAVDCPKCGASLGYSGEVDKNTSCGRCGWNTGAGVKVRKPEEKPVGFRAGDKVRHKHGDYAAVFTVSKVAGGKAYIKGLYGDQEVSEPDWHKVG